MGAGSVQGRAQASGRPSRLLLSERKLRRVLGRAMGSVWGRLSSRLGAPSKGSVSGNCVCQVQKRENVHRRASCVPAPPPHPRQAVSAAGKEQDVPVGAGGPGWEKGGVGPAPDSLQSSLRMLVQRGPRNPAGVRFKEGRVTGVLSRAAMGRESSIGSGGKNSFRGTMPAGPRAEGGRVGWT